MRRYAAYFNTRRVSSGHVWQDRYYSCPLDLAHLWAALSSRLSPCYPRPRVTPVLPRTDPAPTVFGRSVLNGACSFSVASLRFSWPPRQRRYENAPVSK
jgi:hypothetical protein